MLRSLLELVKFSSERGLAFHLENNTAFDEIYSEADGCLAIVNEVRERGLEIYFLRAESEHVLDIFG